MTWQFLFFLTRPTPTPTGIIKGWVGGGGDYSWMIAVVVVVVQNAGTNMISHKIFSVC